MQPGAFPPWPQASPSATPLRGADGLASNSSTRLLGCALLAVNAPPSGGPTLRLGIGARLQARPLFEAGLRAPHPRPSLNCPASPCGYTAAAYEGRYAGGSSSGDSRRSISLAGMR